MENLQQRTLKGINIFKSNLLLFLFICLISSIVSIYVVPFLVSGSTMQQEISEAINQVGMSYGGALAFSIDQIISSIVSFFRFSVLSTVLMIFAYIVKYKIDKDMFRMNSWRDWKFFLYITGISLIIVDIFQGLTLNNGNDFIMNLILTIFFCVITIVFSSVILPEELKKINLP